MPSIAAVAPPYTSRLLKGAALFAEMRQLVRAWDDSPRCAERIVRENVLSSPSRMRVRDFVLRIFVPRFVDSRPPDLWKPLQVLERAGWVPEALLPIHYYAAAAAEPLLWDFVADELWPRHARGQPTLTTRDAIRFLDGAPAERFGGRRWSRHVTRATAQGLLTALRDFGALSGKATKHLSPLYLPTESFAFLAFLRASLGHSGRRALTDDAWRLFYMAETAVERFFVEAQQRRLLDYHAAGSVVRIGFPAVNLLEYTHVLAERAR